MTSSLKRFYLLASTSLLSLHSISYASHQYNAELTEDEAFQQALQRSQAVDDSIARSSTASSSSYQVRKYGTYWLQDLIEISHKPEAHIIKRSKDHYHVSALPLGTFIRSEILTLGDDSVNSKFVNNFFKSPEKYAEQYYRYLQVYYTKHCRGNLFCPNLEEHYKNTAALFGQYADLVKSYYDMVEQPDEQEKILQKMQDLQTERKKIKVLIQESYVMLAQKKHSVSVNNQLAQQKEEAPQIAKAPKLSAADQLREIQGYDGFIAVFYEHLKSIKEKFLMTLPENIKSALKYRKNIELMLERHGYRINHTGKIIELKDEKGKGLGDLNVDQINHQKAELDAQNKIIGDSEKITRTYFRQELDGFSYKLPKDAGNKTVTFTGELLEALLESELIPQE